MPEGDRPDRSLLEPPEPPEPQRPRAVTIRSILLGLFGTALICGLAPYNDFAMSNTFLIGNFLPIGVVLILLVLALAVNAPLRRLAPRMAIAEGELGVALAMMLCACSMPSSGLMRYLPAGMASIPYQASLNLDHRRVLEAANLPRWLFPQTATHAVVDLAKDAVIRDYRQRSPDGSVPWAAWVRPLAIWGVFVAMLWSLVMCLSLIVRRQWTENERLSFPLASIYTSLLESPPRGRTFNELFSSSAFWITASAVFLIHAVNAMHQYQPVVPEIPLGYRLETLFTEPPWSFLDYGAKSAFINFSIVGIIYFVQARTAFSVWVFFVLWQIAKMVVESRSAVFNDEMRMDQTFGGMTVYMAVVLYVGRQHWWMIIRQMLPFLRRPEDADEPSRYLPYAALGWATVLLFAGIVAWMMLIGVSLIAAVCILLSLLLMFMTLARMVAETGLAFAQVNWASYRLFYYPVQLGGPAAKADPTSFFFAGWMAHTFHDLRESFAAFFQHGVRVADEVAYPNVRRWRSSIGLLLAIALALVVGYGVSAVSMLKVEYSYAQPLGQQPDVLLSTYANENAINTKILDPAVRYTNGNFAQTPWTIGTNLTIGAVVVGVCSVLRLTLTWWPLHPVGFIIAYTYAGQKIWFSVLLGWLAKIVILRLGGVSLLQRTKPIFIGMVVGETFAAAFWLCVSLALHWWTKIEYRPILLLPG